MQEYQARVIEEAQELRDKFEKLTIFVTGDIFSSLTEDEKILIKLQLYTMDQYLRILEERICLFNIGV